MKEQDIPLKKIDDNRWMIEQHGAMRTSGVVYAGEAMLPKIMADNSLQQVQNVACMPGIVGSALAMPDIHWGYGFPIGGVAAFDLDEGVVSPGGVGYDINCGVRLMRTALGRQDVEDHVRGLVDALFANIPSGVGSRRADFKLSSSDQTAVSQHGARWAVGKGYGDREDLEYIEDRGCICGADPDAVSDNARERGRQQLGTLGSGNHFVEIAYVDEVFDRVAADVMGLECGQVVVTVHTGSRGLGYQVCDDYVRTMQKASRKYGIVLPDRQLCCAPVSSPEGNRYLAAMAAAANYAFANRQIIAHWVRESFEHTLGINPSVLRMDLVYDVCHNIAKIEEHTVDGQTRELCVHRKGATRAFGPGHTGLPESYLGIGQPVLIPGDMGRCSYVLVGTHQAMQETFGSSNHGAGRVLSRSQAKKIARGRRIDQELARQGIYVRAAGRATLVEEMPEAYKDVNKVVDVVDTTGIARKVVCLKPLGVMKG
jgi:tRNA-splicing ligase RtcB